MNDLENTALIEFAFQVLGPTINSFIGAPLKNHCNKNVRKIIEIAQRKGASTRSGQVSPRIVKEIFMEGAFIEDELTAEYFGGVLASSKSEISRDDRAISTLKLIESLSSYQIRFHYLVYWYIRNSFLTMDFDIHLEEYRREMAIRIPFEIFENDMQFSGNEKMEVILNHVLAGLSEKGLISSNYLYGEAKILQRFCVGITEPGILIQPSVLGAEVFLIAHGEMERNAKELTSDSLQLEYLENFSISKLPEIWNR